MPPINPSPGDTNSSREGAEPGQWEAHLPEESWLGCWELRAGKEHGELCWEGPGTDGAKAGGGEVWRRESSSWEWVSRDKQGHCLQAFLAS